MQLQLNLGGRRFGPGLLAAKDGPARAVVVHEEAWLFADALRDGGFDVAAYPDAFAAMGHWRTPSGWNERRGSARMGRVKRPEAKIAFLEQADDPALDGRPGAVT